MKTLHWFIAFCLLCSPALHASILDDPDSLLTVRQQAYELAYKKHSSSFPAERQAAVSVLVQGLDDENAGLRGQVLDYLQNFAPSDFDATSQAAILSNLQKPNRPHYADLVLLAGYLGIGRDELERQYATPGISVKKKWNLALALARLGNEEALNYCISKVKKAPLDNTVTDYVLPDLLYTRQKAAVDYCVECLYSDEKLCRPANPDLSEAISCAYRIIELLSPVIVDFPVQVDPAIGLESDDYPKTLQTVRDWLKANPNYTIQTDIFNHL